jgi:hypothetical protein
LDDTRIADEYRKQLHKLFSTHNIYSHVTTITERSNSQECSILDEDGYEKIDRDITRSMLGAARKCGSNNKKWTPWSPSLGVAMQAIIYWDVIIKRQVKRDPSDLVLNFYLMKSDVDKEAHDCALPVQECNWQLNFSRQKLKDVVANAKEHRGKYEVQVAQAIVEKRKPRYKEGEIFDPAEKEILVEKEVKVRENRKTAQRLRRKMGCQIRGHIKPSILQRSRLMHIEMPINNETTWTKIDDKDEVEHHPIARNVEQFSDAGATPFGLKDLGRELGHTGDSAMAEDILDGTLEHDCMKDEVIRAIVQQLKRHPAIQGIMTPIVSA